ncbi:MAG: MFS transporter [Rickettsia endosymbiont of Pseudomimeciton antennatum]|nr:MFS transporter [Rickettsia endosymbiont of Pseudomimeciton antennatum]
MTELVQENTRIVPTSLTREQKEAVGLLSIGTFLEYFDLMLYVHMAVLLNELFFPKTDPHTTAIYSATAFCSTFFFRPFGALIFGWLGDNIGRKSTVIITTFMMSLSCIIMAVIPTYAEKGIIATVLVTFCRVIQGMASMGEAIGAELYLTETTSPPIQYPAVASVSAFIALGMMTAVGFASLITSNGINWRYAFFIGAIVAVIGIAARTSLRETPEFADAKRRIKLALEKASQNPAIIENSIIWKEKANKKTAISLFLIQCSWPACFYFAYFYCGNILTNTFGYSSTQVINHNFILSIVQLISVLWLMYLSYHIHPLKIVKTKLVIFSLLTLICPYLLNNIGNTHNLLIFQSIFIILISCSVPAVPIFFKHFPVFKRFTYTSVSYALSRAFIYVVTSFGFVYITKYFGHWGVLTILLPINIGFAFGLHHFEKLEKEV